MWRVRQLAYPVIGQNVQLEITEGHLAGRYASRIQDLEKTKVFIDYPLKTGAQVPTTLAQGQQVLVRYRSVDGAQCSFMTRVIGRDVRQIPLLSLHKPHISEIHRMQRREFLRVPITALFDIVFMDSATKGIISSQAYGVDISGGGLAFRVKKDSPIAAGDIIGFKFQLPAPEGQKAHEVVAKARVIRVSPPRENDLKLVSLKYFEINEGDRQRIVQYSFKRQIQMREKGVLD
jgi:c-di-GMP-binding flagellar brake protein YcgR